MEAYIELSGDGFSEEEFADVKKCLEVLLSIREGSLPMDRDFGIDLDNIAGYPLNVAQNMLALEITEKVRDYEPRAQVKDIQFKTSISGQIKPYIYFAKAEGYVYGSGYGELS